MSIPSPIIYPVGYSARYALQRVDTLMQQPHVRLVDLRCNPTSQFSQWRRKTLERVYGAAYYWAGASLGNRNYDNDLPIELLDPEPGIARLCEFLQQGDRLILLCQCPEYRVCHRAVVVRLLQQAMPSLQVVQPETLPEVQGYWGLSIRPPYSYWLANPTRLMELGLPPKTLENRGWTTRFRGEILLHSGTTVEPGAFAYWKRIIPGLECLTPTQGYPRGAFIGRARLADVVTSSRDVWFCGPYGFVLEDAQPIEPIPYPGALKIFEVPRSIIDQSHSTQRREAHEANTVVAHPS
ncbi:hypothetical protein KDA_75880 [Dictyobacter alpinus]|uniref:DUF488 domain-containing protein n=1 Tax=Dictyobacter alpinus TaxID=2014873 RepID=A0A402BL80_9CHLR|nr:DUF488 family protein [Dictyobacter alpinus]GCE32104.1 hypothetical protein KDA_75880 [Dictyobacter alpinus]